MTTHWRVMNWIMAAVFCLALAGVGSLIAYAAWNAGVAADSSGRVVEHRYVPAQTVSDCTPGLNGDPRPRCTTRYEEESYQLRIERTGWDVWIRTDGWTYARCQDGEWWDAEAREGCRAR